MAKIYTRTPATLTQQDGLLELVNRVRCDRAGLQALDGCGAEAQQPVAGYLAIFD